MRHEERIEWTRPIPEDGYGLRDLADDINAACRAVSEAADKTQVMVFGPHIAIGDARPSVAVVRWTTAFPQEARDVLGKIWVVQGENTSRFHPVDTRPEAVARGYAVCLPEPSSVQESVTEPAAEAPVADEPPVVAPAIETPAEPAPMPSTPVVNEPEPTPPPAEMTFAPAQVFTMDGKPIIKGMLVTVQLHSGVPDMPAMVAGDSSDKFARPGKVKVKLEGKGGMMFVLPSELVSRKE